jgi:membrane protein implicated in regulation of membrane protease activity
LVAVPLLAVLLGIALEIRPGAAPLRFGVAAALVVSLLLVRSRLPVRAVALGVAVAALLGAGWASYRAQAERENAKRTRYGAVYTELMAYADPTETVGYVNLRRIYPAVGRAWRRRLVPCLPDSDDPARWVRRLREQGISLLLVGHTEAPAAEAAAVRHVQKWVRDEAGPFDLVHDFQSRKRHVAIFRLR